MRFEYTDEMDVDDCVAYIDDGGLVVRSSFDSSVSHDAVTIFDDGSGVNAKDFWDPYNDNITKRFYPGDKLTITF